jgi:hypothetical protein
MDVEKMARELLADYFTDTERPWTASLVRQGRNFDLTSKDAEAALARALSQPASIPSAYALTMLVAVGYVTQAKVDEALNIALGFSSDRLPPASAAVVPEGLRLGETIYTPPGEEVRFCYTRGQPDNLNAWRLGEACRRASESPGGDYIDGGLSLLKELESRGYGVFRFVKDAAAPTPPATAQEDGRDAVYGYCPICGAKGAARERRPNGDDICANKHKYPSRSAIKKAAMLTSPDSGKEG